ncbi:MAG TPA: AP2/ERF family transcription factor [Flavobacteriales bacterium]|nr:AP2/ERF family transcription factor [Flavobacteriales bacterium]HMR26019.1 AP2/ERF family transcription factor [Flavobacteriales bacterium]
MSKKVEIPNLHHIRERERGWFVQLRHDGKITSRQFGVKRYNGKENALIAAIKFRDNFIKEHNIDLNKRFKKPDIQGVSLTTNNGRKGERDDVWQAFGTIDGKSVTRRFPVKKHGFDEAHRLAIEAKKEIDLQAKTGQLPNFAPPEDVNIKVWRYMNFTKFVYTLEKKALFFSHVDDLGDPYEGELSFANKKLRSFIYSRSKQKPDLNDLNLELQETRKRIFVNCWHMNKSESDAMWKIYAKSNEAICIQSTYTKLRKSLPEIVKTGKIKYIDYDRSWIPESDPYYPYLHKRDSFSHEKEIRGLIDSLDIASSDAERFQTTSKGIWVEVPLSGLVDVVYVAPNSPSWFKDLVEAVMQRYALRKKVIRSPLLYKPRP